MHLSHMSHLGTALPELWCLARLVHRTEPCALRGKQCFAGRLMQHLPASAA